MDKKTRYTVVRLTLSPNPETFDFHVYSRVSSNKDKMIEYLKYVIKTYPHDKVALVTTDKAKELQKKWYDKVVEKEQMSLAELDRRLQGIAYKQVTYIACGIIKE